MTKKDQCFTLIELVIVVAIIAILGSVLTVFFKRRDPVQSQQAALELAKETRPDAQPIGALCTERDTGSDGYLSCTVTFKSEGQVVERQLLCAAPWTFNKGCKVPVFAPGQIRIQ